MNATSQSTECLPRRRVLYIRHRRKLPVADGLRLNQDEWVEALSLHADVTVYSENFDLGEACARCHPDFILYESPGNKPEPLTITNIDACLDVPRLGFQMQDPHDTARVHFLRICEKMNIHWIFTHMTEAALRQSPELQGRMVSLPLLFDEKDFHEYELEKNIPVSVFGGLLAPEIYNWRLETVGEIINFFPTMIYTHPGYDCPTPRHRFAVVGERYAREINRSYFSLADSTRFDCLVRKHLEIPAAGAVLVAPEASVLEPYGFRDMENCILGSGMELFKKIANVADEPALYEKIRKSGYDLVHSHYSRRHWRGIIDFYEVLRVLKPGETIQQQGILGPFKAVPDTGHIPAIKTELTESAISVEMKKAQQLILSGDSLDEAALILEGVAKWLHHINEPWLMLGIISLLKGKLGNAKRMFAMPAQVRVERDMLPDVDPAEIAWLSLTGALLGDQGLLAITRAEAGSMRHLSLRRLEWLGKVLASGGDTSSPPADVLSQMPGDQLSIHWLGQLSLDEWLELIGRILGANGQSDALKTDMNKRAL